MKKYLIFSIGLFIFTTASIAQKLNKDEINNLNSHVYSELQKEKDVKVTRQTKQGELSSCDIEFINVMRDFASNKGAPLVIIGNLSLMYTKGKNIGYLLKVTPNIADTSSGKWRVISPTYVAMNVGQTKTEKYRVKEFDCENGGKCMAFSDPTLAMTDLLMNNSNDLNNLEIKLAVSKGGTDIGFKLASLVSKEKFDSESLKYLNCSIEVLSKHGKELENLKK